MALIASLRRFGVLWVLLGVVGVLLGVFGSVERSVSRFEVVGVGSRLDVSLPLSDRSPASLSLGFATLGRVPVGRVPVFSGVARDVAWEVRSAGGLVVALDAGGVWLGAKNEWVRVGEWLPLSRYELVVFGDRSAELTRWSPAGAGSVVGRVASGGVPLFEVTGLHARGAGLVSWGDVRVVSSPSEDHRPSLWMLLGYVLVALSAAGVVMSERGSLRRSSMTRWVRDVFVWCRGVWWLWVVVVASIFLIPPDHGESWIVGLTRVGRWVTLNPLTDVVPSSFGGLYGVLLGFWTKSVTPVWLLRLPTAVLFVVAATQFSRCFIVDYRGNRPHKEVVSQSILILLVSVLGLDGEWLRPEIPTISLWMLTVVILSKIAPDSNQNKARFVVAGLLAGLVMNHPLGLPAAASIALFGAFQMQILRKHGRTIQHLVSVVAGSALAVIGVLFGHNITSFTFAQSLLQSNSPRHAVKFDLRPRLDDFSYYPFLFRFSMSLLLGGVTLLALQAVCKKVRISSSSRQRIGVTLIMSLAVFVPSGPWGIYFVYLAPLSSFAAALLPPTVRRSASRVLIGTAMMGIALTGIGLDSNLNYRYVIAPLLSTAVVFTALLIRRPANIQLSVVIFIGLLLNLLPHRVNERFPSVPLLNRPSSMTGSVERYSEFAFQETEISLGRLAGYGPRCGFVSQLIHASSLQSDLLTNGEGHVAHRYGLISPCTKPPENSPNLEGVAQLIHNEPIDMLFFRRVLASFLENRTRDVAVFCLTPSGVEEYSVDIDEAVHLNRPNCLIRTHIFPEIEADTVQWIRI